MGIRRTKFAFHYGATHRSHGEKGLSNGDLVATTARFVQAQDTPHLQLSLPQVSNEPEISPADTERRDGTTRCGPAERSDRHVVAPGQPLATGAIAVTGSPMSDVQPIRRGACQQPELLPW